MERLTQDNFDYCLEMCDSEYMHKCPFYKDERESKCHTAAMYYKLRAYEDTGLSPRQITMAMDTLKLCDSIGAMRMNEILDAERDGRLVVLPCKVGDTVFVFHNGRRNCKWPHNMKKGHIYEVTVSGMRLHEWSDDWSALLFFDTKEMTGDYEFGFVEFGKTIFSTRSKAESAMRGV